MILNIVDRRTKPYRWKIIDAIIEPTWHDNACDDADQAEHDYCEPGYAARKAVTLAEAVEWASAFETALTLYLYDVGSFAVPNDDLSHQQNSN